MQYDESIDTAHTMSADYVPETIVDRDDEQATLTEVVSATGSRQLYIYGPQGTGKTFVTRRVMEETKRDIETSYISCIQFNSQYEVLRQLYCSLTGEEINKGYHTAQLQEQIEQQLGDQQLILVLDDIDFLLENNGDDLLYYLSRMRHRGNLSLVAISNNHPEPRSVVEERTLSSLQLWPLIFEPYSEDEVREILTHRLQQASLLDTVDQEALSEITTATQNVQLALHWLEQAAASAERQITRDLLTNVKSAAAQRYRDILLKDFSRHHIILFEAISQLLVEAGDSAYTGAVYDRYTELCHSMRKDPLSHRRITDFITHLELLNIITVNRYYGGAKGKTREIRLESLFSQPH
jgi:orc1/cdc6 family replication initiation protein